MEAQPGSQTGLTLKPWASPGGMEAHHPGSMDPWKLIPGAMKVFLEFQGSSCRHGVSSWSRQVYPGTMGANFCTLEAHHGDVRQTWDHPGNVGACSGAKG